MSSEQSKIKKILGSKITLFLLLLGFIWLAVNLVNIYYRKYKITSEINDLKAQIEKAEKSNQQISAMIDYLSSQSFLEKEAKEKLNLKREGEEVVIIEPPKENSTTSIIQGEENNPSPEQNLFGTEKKEDSNLMKWWKYFFR